MAASSTKTAADNRADQIIELFRELPRDQQEPLIKELRTILLAEQRKYARKEYTSAVTYTVENHVYNDFIRNISAGGLFVSTEHPMTVGRELILIFPVPGQKADIKISGTIVRVSQDGFGVEFE
ncbi:MAG: PilZ domain-containing protein [Desulfobulbaceae bacterium]|nr:PilZ domain-containing protein [Desulfobulbaceae bacterium]